MPSTTALAYPKYSLWLILVLLILLPGTQADDDWDDFTNDLATDLVSSVPLSLFAQRIDTNTRRHPFSLCLASDSPNNTSQSLSAYWIISFSLWLPWGF